MTRDTKRYRIRAVERALEVLAAFSTAEPRLTLSELSSRMDLTASTVYRLLVTLESKGYVEHDPSTGTYSLGVACLDLSTVFLSQLELRARVLPLLQDLRELCKETVHLAVLDRTRMEVIYLEKLEGLYPIGMMGSRVGGRAPAHCTGLGKCMLAYLPEQEVRDFYAAQGLRKHTARTITDLDSLAEELARTREQSYALDNVEHERDVMCVAAPIWDHEGVVIGAISASGPQNRVERLIADEDLVAGIKTTAQKASRLMGYSPPVQQGAGFAEPAARGTSSSA